MKLKQVKNIFLSTVFIINLVAMLLLVLSAFSDRISPEKSVIFSYLGILFPFILFVNILFPIWWILTGQWKCLLVCMSIFIICSGQIFTYFPFNPSTKNIPDDCIKVLTYNVMRFNQYKKHTDKKPNEIIQYILKQDADIVCLQEYGSVNGDYLISDKDIERIFGKKYAYRKIYYLYRSESSRHGANGGLAIFSKFPIRNFRKISFESEYNGSCVAELEIKGRKVLLVNNHLESNRLSLEDRGEYITLVDKIKDLDSRKVEEIGLKMVEKLSPAYKIRAKQSQEIAKIIKETDIPYVIVCGDFNDTPISYTYRTIKNGLVDSFAETGFGPGISYNQNRFWFRIDFIMHSKNLKAYNCLVDRIKYSDHYPVRTYLDFED